MHCVYNKNQKMPTKRSRILCMIALSFFSMVYTDSELEIEKSNKRLKGSRMRCDTKHSVYAYLVTRICCRFFSS